MLNRLDDALFDHGLSWQEYRARIQKNQAIFDEVYQHPALAEQDLLVLRSLPPLTIIAIGEDWCPDVYHTLPTWVRVSEALESWACRIFPRDENPELMDGFLHKSRAKRIPVYAFYDRNRSLQCWWSGRCRHAQEQIDAIARGRSYEEMDDESRGNTAAVLREGYPARYRRENFEEILAVLRAFFHV
jgi:hypothetical protein